MALASASGRLRILCYHGIWAAPGPHFGDKLFMSPEKFEARVQLMKRQRLEVLPMADALARMRAGRLPQRAAVITMDDGWASTFSHMLPVLERHGYPATVYIQTERLEAQAPVSDVALRYAVENARVPVLVLPDRYRDDDGEPRGPFPLEDAVQRATAFLGLERRCAALPLGCQRGFLRDVFGALELDIDELERSKAFDLATDAALADAHRRGFEMALHTHTHSLGDFSAERIAAEISRNRVGLASMLGLAAESFRHFCWPSGDYTAEAMACMEGLGIEVATTCDFGLAHAGSPWLALPRILDGQSVSDDAFMLAVSGVRSWMHAALARTPRLAAPVAKRG